VEVLTAVAIIAVLVALVFLAFKYVGASAKGNRTAVSLQNLKNMLTEFEHSGGRMGDPSQPATVPPQPAAGLYAIYCDLPNGQLPVPGSIGEGGADRFGEATIRTQRVMRRLLSTPAIKKTFDGLPKESLLYVQYQQGVKYQVGDELIVPTGKDQYDYYVAGPAAPTTGPPGMNWIKTDHHTPVIADAFGNPIVFVPPWGLGTSAKGINLVATGSGSYQKTNQTIVPPGTKLNPSPPPVLLAGGRPFFASAGEDGDFSKGDDNQYSFDQ
jgi:hypothetical protein